MRRFWALLILLFVAGGIVWSFLRTEKKNPDSPWNLAGKPPHLVAHYMPWFQVQKSATNSELTWFHWKWESAGPIRDPTRILNNGLRNISSVIYPLIGPYNSWSERVVRYHLQTAKAAGIQAFLVDWYGPDSYENQQIPLLLKEARKLGMKIAICYEEKINYEKFRELKDPQDVEQHIIADLTYILKEYGHHPAYLKRNGIPFVFQFNRWDVGAPLKNTSPAKWEKIFQKLPGPIVYGRQNFDGAFHPPMQAAYLWWTPEAHVIDSFQTTAEEARKKGKLLFYMSMVSPGFDDTGVWGWGQGVRKTERFGLSVLRDTFDRAWAQHPELIQVVTWNDFEEGTAVEPSYENGFWYLDALETWWGKKTGRPVDLDDNREPFVDYLHHASRLEISMLPILGMIKRPLMVERTNVLESLHQDAPSP